MTISDRMRGTIMVVCGMLVLSIEGSLIRWVTTDRWTLMFWRGLFMFLSLSLGFIACRSKRRLSSFCAIGWTGVIAAVILTAGNILFVSAITLTSIANTLVIVNSAPLLVAFLSRVFLREKVPGRIWIAILVGFAGISIIFHGSLTGGSWAGDLCAFATSFSLALYLILVRYARKINMIPSLALAGFFLALTVFPAAAPFSVDSVDLRLLFLIGGIVLATGMGLISLAPRYIPATEVSLIKLMEAVLGAIWAWIFLAEIPDPESFLGGALVIGALVYNCLAGFKSCRSI